MKRYILLLCLALALVSCSDSKDSNNDNQETASSGRKVLKSLGMEFVLIPSGTFTMGCNEKPETCNSDELPQHQVTLTRPFNSRRSSNDFYMQTTEVTQKQWQEVMGSNPSQHRDPQGPVEMVTWEDARDFVDRLNQLEPDWDFRLPTEAEWEYACRAGTTTKYNFGSSDSDLVKYGWVAKNAYFTATEKFAHKVAQKPPNAWGLYDMHGNVSEWCQDWTRDYISEPVINPKGPTSGTLRVFRGCSWGSDEKPCWSSYRGNNYTNYRCEFLGLRLAFSPRD